jgi:signal transduction histidine kinase
MLMTGTTGVRRARWAHTAEAAGALLATLVVALVAGTALLAGRTGASPGWALVSFAAVAGLLGALVLARRPGSPVGWCFAATGSLFGLGLLTEQVALAAGPGPLADVAAWCQLWTFQVGLVPFFVLVPLYFPQARVGGTGLRWVPPTAFVLMGCFLLASFLPQQVVVGPETRANPFGLAALRPLGPPGVDGLGLATLALVAVVLAGFVARFRRATGEERAQLTWVVWAASLLGVGLAADAATALLAPRFYPAAFTVVQVLSLTVVVAAGVAVLRHNLFDVDLLVDRTLVYGGLTAVLLGAYGLVVLAARSVFADRLGATAELAATAVVAVSFAPARQALQRLVDRWAHGERSDPYRLLRELGHRLEEAATSDAVLGAILDAATGSLRLSYAVVEVRRGDRSTGVERGSRTTTVPLHRFPLVHAGARVGTLAVEGRGPRGRLGVRDLRLLEELARQAGPAVYAARLTGDLQRSRERLVLAREEERRRIGRDLHDGLGPDLALLAMGIEAARDLDAGDPARTRRLLAELHERAVAAVTEVRRVAHGLRPPVLDSLGLAGALRSLAEAAPGLTVRVDLHGDLDRLPAAVEVAAYRIAAEAVHNVAAHAGARTCRVALERRDGALRLVVTDDGHGIPQDRRDGVGLASLHERATELGGTCTVRAGAPAGTVVTAMLPVAPAGGGA